MKIKQLRIEKGKNQEEIAKLLGIRQESYSAYELNKTQPSIENLIKLADFFNVSLDYLCDRQFNNQIGYIREDRKELIKLINEMSENDVKEITAYVKGYIAGKSGNTNFKIFG